MNIDVKPGDRIKIHPASDWFMRGVVYATVRSIGRNSILVESDHGRFIKLAPQNVLEVVL